MMTHGGCFFFFLSTAGETQRYILYITMPCYSGKKASCVSKCYTRYIIYPYITIPCAIHYYNMLMHGSFWFSELGPSTSWNFRMVRGNISKALIRCAAGPLKKMTEILEEVNKNGSRMGQTWVKHMDQNGTRIIITILSSFNPSPHNWKNTTKMSFDWNNCGWFQTLVIISMCNPMFGMMVQAHGLFLRMARNPTNQWTSGIKTFVIY